MKISSIYSFLLAMLIFAAHVGVDFNADCCDEITSVAAIFSNNASAKDLQESHSCCKKDTAPKKCCDKTTVQTPATRLAVVSHHTEFVALVPDLGFCQKYFQHQTFTTVERPQLPILRPPFSKLPRYILFSQNIIYA